MLPPVPVLLTVLPPLPVLLTMLPPVPVLLTVLPSVPVLVTVPSHAPIATPAPPATANMAHRTRAGTEESSLKKSCRIGATGNPTACPKASLRS
jgi:hypothetical protein